MTETRLRLPLMAGLAILTLGLGLRAIQPGAQGPAPVDCTAERAAAASAEPGFVVLAGSGNPACF